MYFIDLYTIKIKFLLMKDSSLTDDDIDKINNQNKLLEIFKNQDLDTRVRSKAAENIEDKSIFKDYAYDDDSFLRVCAAQYTDDDDEMLLNLILNDSNVFVRYYAGWNFVRNCDNEKYEDILLEFALENPEYNVAPIGSTDKKAKFASHRINDASKFLRIIEKSKSKHVYSYAVGRVSKDDLSELLYSGKLDTEKTIFIAKELKDYEKLRELLYGGKVDFKNSMKIAMELEDDEFLKKNLGVPIGPHIREGKVFPDIFPGDGLYTEIVFSYPNEEVVIKALNLIGYKHSLKYIIDNHKNPKICKLAKERLKQL